MHVPAWRAGGVNVVLTTLYVEEEHKPDRALRRAVTLLGAALNDIAETPEVALCGTRGAIDAAVARGQIAFVLGIEGGECIQDGIESLRVFAGLGVRVLGLTWNQRNLLAEGVGEERAGGGLTERGRAMVAEANRLGVLLDVSHLSVNSFWDLAGDEHCARSSPRTAMPRRSAAIPATSMIEQLRAVAATGGTIGINLCRRLSSRTIPPTRTSSACSITLTTSPESSAWSISRSGRITLTILKGGFSGYDPDLSARLGDSRRAPRAHGRPRAARIQ